MKKINLIADIFGLTGYAVHGKELANALNDIGCDVKITTNKPNQWERDSNDFELNAIGKDFDPECTTIMIGMPHSWPVGLSQKPKKFYGFLVWEGSHIPEYWLEYLYDDRVNGIFVPSEHTKQAILNTAGNDENVERLKLIDKIHIIPHGYDPKKYFIDDTVPKFEKLTFITNKGWVHGEKDRGGIQFLMKAFTEEFTNKDDVQLMIKLNSVYNREEFDFREECKKIGIEKTENSPSVMLIKDALHHSALNRFYNQGDVFISTSMAEAFNIPVLESLVAGVPAIITNFGGHIDFVNENNGWLIKEGIMGYHTDDLLYENTQWFKPDIKEIRSIMRSIYNNREVIKEKKKQINLTGWTWRDTAKKIVNII